MKINKRSYSAIIKTALFFVLTVFSQSELYPKQPYLYWDNIHYKYNDEWYVKSGNKYLRIDFNDIYIGFKNVGLLNTDSLLKTWNCVVRGGDSRNNYYLKFMSSTEFFYFLRQISYNRNVERVSVKTKNSSSPPDSLITEIRLVDKSFILKNSQWYMSLAGELHEVWPDIVSLKFKTAVNEKQQNQFIEQHQMELLKMNRLNICDLRVSPKKHAIFTFFKLYKHPLLEFVEVNTR